jgi:hypothetical protein
MLSAFLIQPLLAGTPAEREEEIRRMREKEAERAKIAAQSFSDQESFVKKYETLKESEPRLFADAMEKRLLAAKAWTAVASGVGTVDGYEQLTALKMPAYDAEAVAEIARMEMKAAYSEKDWKRNAEKSDSKDASALAEQMIQNQRAVIQATKQKYSSERLLRQLEIDRTQIEKKMRDAYEQSKRKEQEKRERKDKDSSREHEKRPDQGGGGGEVRKPDKILVE